MPANTLANTTSCERNITDIQLAVTQTVTDDFDPSVNVADPYYVRSLQPANLTVIFSVAGPINLYIFYQPDVGENHTFSDTGDFPLASGPHQLVYSMQRDDPECYVVSVSAWNQHNRDSGPISNLTNLCVQHEVLTTWTMAATPAAFLVPSQVSTFMFEMTAAGNFPTNASVDVLWGDGSALETLPFGDTNGGKPIVTHTYTSGGIFNVSARIYNIVSSFSVSCQVKIVEEIVGLKVATKYFPSMDSPISDVRDGYGSLLNQYPINKNLSFFPTMDRGTVSHYTVSYTYNGTEVMVYYTMDEYNPTAFPFHHHFNFESILNLTVTASNEFQDVSIDLLVEIVGKVRSCVLSDFNMVTAKGESKTIQVSFESIGGGTCLLFDYGDSLPLVPHSYGEKDTCDTEFQHAIYHADPELDMALNFTHVYMEEGIYNLTIIGWNELSNCTSTIATYVTNIHCTPPAVSIMGSTMDVEAPPQFMHSKGGKILGVISIDCEVTSNTKKRWQVYEADPITATYLEPVLIMYTWKSWDAPELVIPKHTLKYGFYLATYTVTMWDPDNLPVDMPFQRQAVTLFEMIPTPIIAIIMDGAVSKTSRGPSQEIPLNPCLLSVDPDFPDDKNFNISWRCRKVGEEWPNPDPGPTSIWEQGPGNGCFGNGPGKLDHNLCELILMGDSFKGLGTFELEVTVSKDDRSTKGFLQIEKLDYDPPILNMSCASPDLCVVMEEGLMVNPCKRVGIVAECIGYCLEPHVYQWEASMVDGMLFPYNSAHFPNGFSENELMFSTQFFEDNPSITHFHLTLKATTSDDRLGESSYFFIVNQRPAGGTCTFVATGQSRALIDSFFVNCEGWTDPDDHGIKSYVIILVDSSGAKQTLINQQHSVSQHSMEMVLQPGNFSIVVKILDTYDACTELEVVTDLEVRMPTTEELKAVDIDAILEELAGTGNTQLLNTYILAASYVTNQLFPLDDSSLAGLTEDEINERIVARTNELNKHLDYLMMNGNYDTVDSVNVVSSVLAQILTNLDGGKMARKAIDTEAHSKIVNITKGIRESYPNLSAPDPRDWMPTTKNLGVINTVMGKSQDEGSSREEDGTCSPNILEATKNHKYPTHVTSIDLVLEETIEAERDCNTLDFVKNKAKKYVPSLWDTLHDLFLKMSKTMVLGEIISDGNERSAEYTIQKQRRVNFNSTSVGNLGTELNLPEAFCPFENCTMDSVMSMLLVEWPCVLFSFPDTSKKLAPGTRVVDIELLDAKSNVIEVKDLTEEEEVEIAIPKSLGKDGNNTLPALVSVNATEECAKLSIPILYSTFNVSEDDSVIRIHMKVDALNAEMFIVLHNTGLGYGTDYLVMSFIDTWEEQEGLRSLFLLSRLLKGRGRYFLGVAELRDASERAKITANEKYNITASSLRNITTNYSLRLITDTAFYLNMETGQWQSDGLRVIEASLNLTKIKSSHLTSFGTGMFVAPNTIDFSYVFTHMGFTDNLTIYLTLIISLTLFIILMVWARIHDRKDVQKLGATPLPDNKGEDKYLYEVLVITGNMKSAQTDSKVQFIVSGEKDETDIRTLSDDKRKILRKDSVDVFVMAVPRPMGDLQFLRIWHDNSGLGPNGSWYLSFIVFRDVQTGKKYEFIVNNWLAVEYGDGQIDRLVPAAGQEEKKAFKHLFRNTSNKNLSDGHLWFSVFLRPHRSRFTRCQRVASCFSLLFLFMLVNAMWYERAKEQPGKGGLSLGPFSLSMEQLAVGFMSNIIVFVPSLVILFIFRKARPRKLRKNRIEVAVKKMRKCKENEGKKKDGEDSSNYSDSDEESDEEKPSTPPRRVIEQTEKKKKFTLPWWTVFIGWMLVIGCMAVSCFFLLMYGIMFGDSKATKWVTSLVISFFTDILFVEPIKIFLTALVLSAVCKTENLDEDDAEEDEEEPYLEQDEAWLHNEGPRRRTLQHHKVDEETLAEIRRVRKNEMEMWEIIKEIISYSMFLWVFLALSYSNRDPNAYYLQNHLQNVFIREGMLDDTDFTQATNSDRVWFYILKGFMKILRADKHYNGQEPYGLKGYLRDQANRIMGYATIRQIRVKENTCSVPRVMQKVGRDCSAQSGLLNEENSNFCAGWKRPTSQLAKTSACSIPEFKYSTALELKSLPIWGRRDWYGGGGYVIHLRNDTEDVLANLKFLQENHWIDTYTRAVLIEFSTYNPQINLFGLTLIMAEIAPGGGITPMYRFEGIRLLQYQTSGFFVIFCQVVFILFVIYFTGHELLLLYRQRCKYFQNYWSYAEMAIIVASYLGIIIYVLRDLETNTVLKEFARTSGNGYIRMQYAATLHEIYGYIVGFIVFVGTIKFIKLLRFNKRIGLLSATLSQCWDDLSGFLVAFLLCFFTFVTMFFMLLNMYLFDFHNFVVAVETCFSMMLGKFQFEEMQQVSRLVPIMFFVFVLFNSWVLINLLLTLIIKTFTQVKYDIANKPNEYEMVDFVWRHFRAFLGGNSPPPKTAAANLNPTQPTDDAEVQSPTSVNEFPGKVDKFLEYVNSMYFDGSLNLSTKDSLLSSMYSKSQFNAPR